MAGTAVKMYAAVWAAIIASGHFATLLFMSVFVLPVLMRLPAKYRPKDMQRMSAVMTKKYSLDICLNTLEVMWRERYEKLTCPLKCGMRAPNVSVLSMEGNQLKLLDFQKQGRILIVSFGSCT